MILARSKLPPTEEARLGSGSKGYADLQNTHEKAALCEGMYRVYLNPIYIYMYICSVGLFNVFRFRALSLVTFGV